MRTREFDYIVIGGGSAGCVVASRLSEDPENRVLLLEAGRVPKWWNFKLHVPAAKGLALRDDSLVWGHETVEQPNLANRRIALHQGRVAGGSSAINGMVFVRGNPGDYDGWAKDPDLAGWRFDQLLPYFRKLESYLTQRSFLRGDSGPVGITRAKGLSPLARTFIDAGTQVGLAENSAPNGASQEGVGLLDMNVSKGRRNSSWSAYIQPILERHNLTVLSNAEAVTLRFEKQMCVGTDVLVDGVVETFHALRETICSAGVFGSPALLLRSGIGPADDLQSLGIPVVHDLFGVGRNLHDHLQACVLWTASKPVTLQPLIRSSNQLAVGLRWLTTRNGLGASNHFEAGAFAFSGPSVEWPDIQLLFSPHTITRIDTALPPNTHGYQVHASGTRPLSRGQIRLQSSRHDDPLIIDPGYLKDERDWSTLRAALRLARNVLSADAFLSVRREEILPGPEVRTDDDLDRYIRETAGSGYHLCGTCKMGSGEEAVVDGSLRVRGLKGLRVVDSSIIPSIPTGNINATVLMIGEVASDLIQGKAIGSAK